MGQPLPWGREGQLEFMYRWMGLRTVGLKLKRFLSGFSVGSGGGCGFEEFVVELKLRSGGIGASALKVQLGPRAWIFQGSSL